MAELIVQDVAVAGIEPLYDAAASGGDTFTPVEPAPGERILLHVRNSSATSRTVTVVDPTTVAPAGVSAFDPNVQAVTPAGSSVMILLDPIDRFVHPDTGQVTINYTASTGITVGIFRMV